MLESASCGFGRVSHRPQGERQRIHVGSVKRSNCGLSFVAKLLEFDTRTVAERIDEIAFGELHGANQVTSADRCGHGTEPCDL